MLRLGNQVFVGKKATTSLKMTAEEASIAEFIIIMRLFYRDVNR